MSNLLVQRTNSAVNYFFDKEKFCSKQTNIFTGFVSAIGMIIFTLSYVLLLFPSTTRQHGNFAGVLTLLRILLSSNSAVLINIITGVSPPHFDFVVFY
jgi:tetrahydromethanopterin S-methyltransferase subunit E